MSAWQGRLERYFTDRHSHSHQKKTATVGTERRESRKKGENVLVKFLMTLDIGHIIVKPSAGDIATMFYCLPSFMTLLRWSGHTNTPDRPISDLRAHRQAVIRAEIFNLFLTHYWSSPKVQDASLLGASTTQQR